MDWPTLWKLIGVTIYLLALLGIGALASRRMHDVKDYFAGGKKLGFWAVAFSARATGESAWLLLGLTGMGAAFGLHAFWVVVGEVIGVMGAWLLLSRRFKRMTDRYDSITVPDYLEDRFRDSSQILRLVSAVALIIFVTIYVSAQIDATGKAFEQFVGINYFLGALIGFCVVLGYSVSGGFLAVVWSDVFQGTLMFLGLVTLPLVGLYAAGGPSQVMATLQGIDPALLTLSGQAASAAIETPADTSWVSSLLFDGWTMKAVFGTLGLALIGLGFLGSPQIFVRFLALRSENEIPKGAMVAFVWTFFADAGAVLVGITGRALLTGPTEEVEEVLGKDAENVLPMMVDTLLPAVLIGLFIAIVLAAIMSTVDSLLVLASSALVRDVYQKILKPHMRDDELVSTSRLATMLLACIALAVALTVALLAEDRTIFWFVIFGWSGIAATFCPTVILSLFWTRMTRRGALAAMITGFACVPLFKFGMPALFKWTEVPFFDWMTALAELPPAFLLSGLAGVFVSLIDTGGAQELTGIADEMAS